MRRFKEAVVVFLLLAALSFGVFWTAFQWNECRNEGLSFSFCVQHIIN